MTSIELEARKTMLIRELLDEDNLDILDKIERIFRRSKKAKAVAKEDITPYTMEEINRWIDEGEAEEKTTGGVPSTEVFGQMETKYPWLCKYK